MINQKIIKIFGAVFLIIAFGGFFPGKGDIYFEVSKNIDLFSKIYKEISFNYVDDIDPEEFMQSGIQGMLETLDPYTIFIDENKKDEIELITNGKYGGVGISIGVRGNNVTVVEVLDGYSAQRQGMRIGDVLIEASGIKISPDNIDQVSSLVKGEPGTVVDLKIIRNEDQDTLIFNVVREEVIVKNLTYYGFYPENSNNVYLKLSSFSRSAGDEIKKALKELKSQKEIKSIVLDLRGNPGGLLDVAVDIADKFLSKNLLIVSTKGRDDSSQKEYFSVQEPMVGEGELIVLVNEGSASAAEIVAGAIQDHDRGVILGTKTFGKGLVQTITPLNFNTSLKITTAKYYTPSGRCIQKIDYSKKNKVFKVADTTDIDSPNSSPFYTDNKRLVYSAGGITPDTAVDYNIEGDITGDLLAQGLFFKFADYYYYLNQAANFGSIQDENIFNEFKDYLGKEKFVYHSEAEKQISKLIEEVESKKWDESIASDLKKIKNQFENLEMGELKSYKGEVIRELKTELASRYLGTDGRIIETLKYDNQLQTALNVIGNKSLYKRLLNYN